MTETFMRYSLPLGSCLLNLVNQLYRATISVVVAFHATNSHSVMEFFFLRSKPENLVIFDMLQHLVPAVRCDWR